MHKMMVVGQGLAPAEYGTSKPVPYGEKFVYSPTNYNLFNSLVKLIHIWYNQNTKKAINKKGKQK